MEKIPDIIHESWHQHLQPLFDDPKMIMIKTQLLTHCKFYPSVENIFRVFEMPLNQIKVVILGQDPYFNGSANGLAFAVNKLAPMPKSLQIIQAEVFKEDISQKDKNLSWRTLKHWEEQGVFLLNSALTVEIGMAGSHLGQWSWFTREVIRVISGVQKPIWMLWGAKAQGFKDYIANNFIVTKNFIEEVLDVPNPIGIILANLNYILEAPHPAAETHPNSYVKKTFTGCNHFILCNKILHRQQKKDINW